MIKRFISVFTRRSGTGNPTAVLAAVCLAALALPLGFSGGALATPAIGRELGGGPAALNWVTNAFMLAFGSLLMAAGTCADRYGRRRVFALGVGGFAVCSLLLCAAPTLFVLDLLRALQGIAAAAALAGGTAALAQEYDGPGRTRAFSLLGTTFGLGLAFGPVLAGVLIEHLGWRAVFATGAVTTVPALAFGVPRMRESHDPGARTIDWPGIATFTGARSCFTYALIESAALGWSSSLVRGLLAGSVVLAAAFWRVETRAVRPMLDLTLLRYRRFLGVQLLPVATCYGYIVLLVVLPLRLVGVDGFGAVAAGGMMVALSAPLLVVPMLAALLTRWLAAGVIAGVGLALASAGLVWLAAAFRHGADAGLVAPLLAIGIGAGLPWGLMDGLSVSVVPKERAGMAAGVFSTARVAGECIALATVDAALTVLAHARIAALDGAAVPAAAAWSAAARLGGGDLAGAAALLPHVSRHALLSSHAAAFDLLLHALAAVTLACACAVVLMLGRARADADPSPSPAARASL